MSEENVNQPATDAPVIGIDDLTLMLQVVDAFAMRGNLRGDELTPVGRLRDRLFKFLSAVEEAEKARKAAEEGVEGSKGAAPEASQEAAS